MADWVQWFCSMRGHDFFCEVDRSYMESRFNTFGLNQEVPTFSRCLSIILDYVSSESDSDEVIRATWSRKECLELYGRIHARFILTARGQDLMHQKFMKGDFGVCPRFYCNKQPVLPVGLQDNVNEDRVRTFCPKCHQVFIPPDDLAAKHVDGAYFGRTFPNLFLLRYPDLIEKPPIKEYVPTVYGYKLHPNAAAFKFKHLLTDGTKPAAPAAPKEKAEEDRSGGGSKRKVITAGSFARRRPPVTGTGLGQAIAGAATGGNASARSLSEKAASRKQLESLTSTPQKDSPRS